MKILTDSPQGTRAFFSLSPYRLTAIVLGFCLLASPSCTILGDDEDDDDEDFIGDLFESSNKKGKAIIGAGLVTALLISSVAGKSEKEKAEEKKAEEKMRRSIMTKKPLWPASQVKLPEAYKSRDELIKAHVKQLSSREHEARMTANRLEIEISLIHKSPYFKDADKEAIDLNISMLNLCMPLIYEDLRASKEAAVTPEERELLRPYRSQLTMALERLKVVIKDLNALKG